MCIVNAKVCEEGWLEVWYYFSQKLQNGFCGVLPEHYVGECKLVHVHANTCESTYNSACLTVCLLLHRPVKTERLVLFYF